MQLRSTLTCPKCSYQAVETMPTDACQFFYDSGRVKTFSSPKNCTQPSVIHFDATVCAYFAVSSQESIRAQPRATQNDLNGHTARTTVHAPQARIAARSGLIPTMFITRVRL